MRKLEFNVNGKEILIHLDHIESHVSQVCDKDWLQEELSQLREKIEKLVNA